MLKKDGITQKGPPPKMDTTLELVDQAELRKRSLKESVFDLLHQRIVTGKYGPGEWLRQEELSSQLGVSQTPVREALDLLVSVGLAERVPYRGVRVPKWDRSEIVDAYILRLVLESAAARLAAQNITIEQQNSLLKTVEQTKSLTRLEDMSSHRRLNKQLHQLIADASGNTLMSKLYKITSNLFPDWRLYEYMFRHPELLKDSLEREYLEHLGLVEAISAHNPEEAGRRAVQHIQNLKPELVNYLGVSEELIEQKECQIQQLLSLNS